MMVQVLLRGHLASWSALGAKLGAMRCGIVWTAMDVFGLDGLAFRAVWTAVDAYGHRLEIYGSEGRVVRISPGVPGTLAGCLAMPLAVAKGFAYLGLSATEVDPP